MTFTWVHGGFQGLEIGNEYMAGRIRSMWGRGTLRAISHARPAITVLSRALNREGSGYETNDAGGSELERVSLSCLGQR